MKIKPSDLREAARSFYAEHGHYPNESNQDELATKYGIPLTWKQVDFLLEKLEEASTERKS